MEGESRSTDTDFRDASFSYLTSAQQNFVVKLTESAQFPYPDTALSQEASAVPINLDKPNIGEGELNVFDAEKYFNMKIEDVETQGSNVHASADKFVHEHHHHPIENGSAELQRMRSKGSRLGAPSASSGSSWNSRTALMPSSKRNLSQTRQKKWLFPGFGCNRSCFDDKSVYIDYNISHRGIQVAHTPAVLDANRSQLKLAAKDDQFCSDTGSKRRDYLVLPTVNSGVQNIQVVRKPQKLKSQLEEDPKKSLEALGSHTIKKEDIASDLERKLSVLTWDAIPFPKAQNLPSKSLSSQIYEDGQSDASSDLFEIENISCSTQPIFTKQTSQRYGPSETSIEWSVVTASAADFSFVSDYNGKKSLEMNLNSATPRIRRPNSLLGCKSQKAVEVAEAAYKKNEKGRAHLHRRS